MSKEEHVKLEGEIVYIGGGGKFRVKCGEHMVLAQLSGKMRKNHIKVVLGDQVTVSVSPYDATLGLITFRKK